MAVNGYFKLENTDGKIFFHAFMPKDGGTMFETDEVVKYFEKIRFTEFDRVKLDNYIQLQRFAKPYLLGEGELIPEPEKCIVRVDEDGKRALARFYPPTTDGAMLTEDDIVSDLQHAGVRHGIRKKAIAHFLETRAYCRDYIMAEATPPVEGKDSFVEYFFDFNVTAKPKLKDDGSVDFHQLGNIEVVDAGTELAALTPADKGRAGMSVLGKPLLPKKVRNFRLRHGRNIRMSEDKCHIYAAVPGYVTLVDDMVMLSDVYKVPANVDASTGDIEFNGSVEVAGNVNTGYKIEATGDVIVNGVVEGAEIISGGNIVIKRGMQGMERGELRAKGNISAKFLENCKVICEGGLNADAVLHSDVACKTEVEVRGKKGLINGGHVRTYGQIHVTSLGSTMGASTKVEVLPDKDLIIRRNELLEKIDETEQGLNKIMQTAESMKEQISKGMEIEEEQLAYLKDAKQKRAALKGRLRDMIGEKETLQSLIDLNKRACIKVEREVFSGVNVVVKDAMKIQHEHLFHCRFVRDGADVKLLGLD